MTTIDPEDAENEVLVSRREREAEAELRSRGLAIVHETASGPTGEHIEIRVKHMDSDTEFDAMGDTRVNALNAVLTVATSRGFTSNEP